MIKTSIAVWLASDLLAFSEERGLGITEDMLLYSSRDGYIHTLIDSTGVQISSCIILSHSTEMIDLLSLSGQTLRSALLDWKRERLQ